MAIVLVDVNGEGYLLFCLRRGRAQAHRSTDFTLEGSVVDGWVMTGVRFDEDVGVCGFSVDSGRDCSRFGASKEDVKKRDAAVDFRFARELYTRMDTVEYFVERFRGVLVIVSAA